MIILYESNETNFSSFGLGVLKDTISCIVKEELNGAYELEMEYPVIGANYSSITYRRIIKAKPNPFDNPQPFRIYEITKPINGIVTIKAVHISYDMSGFTVGSFEGTSLTDTLSKIQNGVIGEPTIHSNFTFTTDKTSQSGMTTHQPYSMRALLNGSGDTVTEIYGGEYKFDIFNVQLLERRGSDRGFQIRYSKNMTDIEQTINSDAVYTAVYPYYFKTTVKTTQTTEEYITETYIVGQTPFAKDWLSLTEGGTAIVPIATDVPVQVKTTGAYKDLIYYWNGTAYEQATGEVPKRTRTVNKTENVNEFIDLTDTGEGLLIYLDQTAVIHKILSLNMSDSFTEKPTAAELKTAAENYINEHREKLTTPTITTKVSFLRLSDSEEYADYKTLERVELGDTVKVIYNDLGISINERINSYTYDSLTNSYTEIELGDEEKTLTSTAITNGDNVTALKNDADYADTTTVKELIAQTITAEYIKATKVQFTDAQIDQLGAGNISVSGTIIALAGQIGGCVIQNGLLQVPSAQITGTITAGNIIVYDTSSTPNKIFEANSDTKVVTIGSFNVDANSLNYGTWGTDNSILLCATGTAGSKSIGGSGSINGWTITAGDNFGVTKAGVLYCNDAHISGEITATSGTIGGCVISNGTLQVAAANITGTFSANKISGGTIDATNVTITNLNASNITSGSINASTISITNISASNITSGTMSANKISGGTIDATNVTITNLNASNITSGTLSANKINGGSITASSISMSSSSGSFSLGTNGVLTCTNAIVSGTITANEGSIAGWIIENSSIRSSNNKAWIYSGTETKASVIYEHEDSPYRFACGEGTLDTCEFVVLEDGSVYTKGINNEGGVIFTTDFVGYGEFSVKHVNNPYTPLAVNNNDPANPTVTIEGTTFKPYRTTYSDTIYYHYTYRTQSVTVSGVTKTRVYVYAKSYVTSAHTTLKTMPVNSSGLTIVINNNYRYTEIHQGYSQSDSEVYADISTSSTPSISIKVTGKTVAYETFSSYYKGLMCNHTFMPDTDAGYDLGNTDRRWHTIYAKTGTINTSDRNDKTDISYDLKLYDDLFDALKPTAFKFKNGNRTHTGFIAQDIKDILEENNIDTNELALYVYDEHSNTYGLRYSEFHALEVRQIQLLKARVLQLENKLKQLEEK